MLKWLRRLLIFFLGLFFILAIAGFFVVRYYQDKYLSPRAITKELEKQWNARVQVAETKIHLFQQPALLEIRGLRLAPRDAVANEGVALKDRTVLPDGQAKLATETVHVKVDLWNYLRGQKLELGQMLLENLDARVVVDVNGFADFDDLFDKPYIVEGKTIIKIKKPKVKVKDKLKKMKPKGGGLAELNKLNLPLLIGTAGLKNARISIVLNDEKKSYLIENFDLMAEELDVDLKNLEQHNKITLRSRGTFTAMDLEKNEQWGKLNFDLVAPLHPVDPAIQEVAPSGNVQITLKKGSQVLARKLKDVLQENADSKTREDLAKYAMDFKDYRVGGEMQNDLVLKLAVDRKLGVALEEDVLAGFPDYSLKIEKGARWEKKPDTLLVDYTLICSPDPSKEVEKAIYNILKDKVGTIGATLLNGSVHGILFDEKGQALLKMRMKGPRSDPKAEPLFMEQIEATLGKKFGGAF